MWIYDPASLQILTVNQAAVQLYGFTRDELLAMSIRELRPPEDVPALLKVTAEPRLARQWRNGAYRHRKKDGTVFPVNVASHGLELDGRQVRVVVITDLTAIRESTRRLREQATLLDSANDAIVVRGLPGDVVTYWNRGAERTYGRPAAEAIGLRFAEATGARGAGPEQARRALDDGGEWSGELTHRRADKSEAIVATRCTLVRDELGGPSSVLSIGTDVTERKKLEAQYLRAQRMESIGTLAGGIAHDLNNVLAPILMSVPLLRGDGSDAEQNEILDSIESSARRGAQMVRQVLLFARGLSGERVLLRPAALLEETRRIASESMPKTIDVRLQVARDLPLLEADATQLQQVLINLAVNARDAMPDGGLLTIGAHTTFLDSGYVAMNPTARTGLHIVFEVADTGTGIPAEIRDRIFDPFFTSKEVGKGTGLGLSTSLAIVKSHGGFFNVYSEPGKGTSFKLYLPAVGDRAEPESVDAAQPPPPRGNGELVLVVDDEAPIRTVARRTLEAAGYRVLEAANGAEALAAFARAGAEVRAVIVDMSMPVMDGTATIKALLHLEAGVRIIAASGLGANGAFARATSAGVRHFLQKPYTAELLLRTTRDVLDGRA
jgi:PAS domain S-box-containing protein